MRKHVVDDTEREKMDCPNCMKLKERVKTLESALEEIATCKTVGHSEARKHRRVAQKALEGEE